jgi:hypothetical protein
LVVVCVGWVVVVWRTTTWCVVVGGGGGGVVVVVVVVVVVGGSDVRATEALVRVGTTMVDGSATAGPQAEISTTPPPAHSTPAQRNNTDTTEPFPSNCEPSANMSRNRRSR